MTISIKNITLPTKSVKIEYPSVPGFFVEVGYISNELTRKLLKAANETKYDELNGINYNETNPEKFSEEFCKHAICGWEGLTGEGLASLILVDLENNGIKPEDTIPFSADNAHTLYMNCAAFSKWIGLQSKNLSLFR